ncbi:hypothetical protein MBLNU457_7523t1 [Dothideomycetes sp. NU457]
MSAPSGAAPAGPFDMIRPEQIPKLPFLSDVEKQKFKAGLERLWNTADSNPKDSDLHNKAIAKIKEVSRELMKRLAGSRNTGSQAPRPQPQGQPQGQSSQQQAQQQTQQQAPQQPAPALPQNQQNAQQAAQKMAQQPPAQQGQSMQQPAQTPQQSSQPEQPARPSSQTQQPQQQQQAQPQAPPQQAQQGQQNQSQSSQQPQMSLGAKNFIQNFKVYPAPNMAPNSKEFIEHRNKVMSTLQSCLISSEKYTTIVKQVDAREKSGQGMSAELMQHRENARQVLAKARSEFDNIKNTNERNRVHWQSITNGGPGQGQGGNMNMNAQGTPGGQQPMAPQAQQQMQPNAQSSQMSGNMQLDASQMRAAQNQMNPANSMPFPNQNQMQSAPSQQGQMQMPQQQQQQPQQQAQNMAGRPQPMPQQQQFANQQAQPSQMGQQPGPPQALSHQAAVNAAARTYSEHQQRSTPSQPATPHGNFTPGMNASTTTTTAAANAKMQITKNLNINPHSPVTVPPARPTFGGPGNGPPGMMGQPAIQKAPGFILEGEGDRVLSKKKLDELVRQVTGGGDGDGLTADVEEAVLALADDFIDNVITSACRLAKIRPDSTLDIRDIQVVLERNYNIRVPGYSLDEVRTVRKFQPAAGWTQKMNAVQAAKVMGKNDV